MAYWDSQFNLPGRLRKYHKRYYMTYTWVLFVTPTLMMIAGSYPKLLLWFTETYKPLEYPPQADPRIISAVFHGRQSKQSSEQSYAREKAKILTSSFVC